MNTYFVSKIQRINKRYVFISLILFFIEVLLFILIKFEVFKSMDFSIQKSLQQNYSDINNIKDIPLFLTIIYYSNKIFLPYIIIIIVYNFSNLYTVLNLFNILSITCYISCVLKFIFYKILTNNNEGKIFFCGEGWNLPSTEMMISVAFYLTLWNTFFNDKDYLSRTKKFFKYFCLGLLVILNIINIIYLVKIGYYLFTHLLFSAIFGFFIYIFVFKTNIIKKYNSKKFCILIKKKFEKYFLIKIILLILSFIPYIIERRIKTYAPSECKSIEGSFYYQNKSPYITYVDETFTLISIYFAQFFVMIGIKCELSFIFQNKTINFEQYHFGIDIDDLKEESEIKNKSGTIVITRDTEWNNTSKIKSAIRLILSFVLSGVCFLPYIFVKREKEFDFSTIFLIKYFLSNALFSFGITFFFKIIFRIFNVSNEILKSILKNQ